MAKTITIYFDAGDNSAKEKERWLPILQAKDYTQEGHDGAYSLSDLDTLVDEYQSRADLRKAPVVLGQFKEGAPAIGTVADLKRQGNAVLARISNLDTKAEQLFDRGVFKKRSVRMERSPDGLSLLSVGLIVPQWNGQLQHVVDDMTPALDDLHKQEFGAEQIIFAESRRVPIDANSQRLSDLAKQRASAEGITFSEALSQVASENPVLCTVRTVQFSESAARSNPQSHIRIPIDANSQRLSDLAKQRASAEGITFSEALSQVASENP
jgi:hypothetical protein